MSNNTDTDKMLRAIAADVASQYLERREKRGNSPGNDPSLLGVLDWETEDLFQDVAIMDPSLLNDPLFTTAYGQFRDSQAARFLQTVGKDSPTGLAMMYQPHRDDNHINIFGFWEYLRSQGPNKQGDVIEIFGTMGSGKSNFMVWMMKTGHHYGFNIISNIHLFHPFEGYYEVHTLSETLAKMAEIRKKDHNAMSLVMIDEQAAAVGSASRTSTKRETRWSDKFLTIIRKFGASIWRSRQFDSVIKEQKTLTSIEFHKEKDKIDEATGKINSGSFAGTELYFSNIPDEKDEYDTNQMSSYSWDIDMEIFDALSAKYEGKLSDNYTMEDMVISIVRSMKQQASKKTPENVLGFYDDGYTPDEIAQETGYSLAQVYNILKQYKG